MKKAFDYDGPFFRFLATFSDLAILNIIFIISCLPVITIGASVTAFYSVLMKIAAKNDRSVFKDYFISFGKNFKKSTLIWLPALLVIFILVFNVYVAYADMSGALSYIMLAVYIFIGLIVWCTGLYYFPLIPVFNGTIRQRAKESFLIAIAHFPSTLLLIFLTAFPFLLLVTLYFGTIIRFLPLFICFSFSITGLLKARILRHNIRKYHPDYFPDKLEEETILPDNVQGFDFSRFDENHVGNIKDSDKKDNNK